MKPMQPHRWIFLIALPILAVVLTTFARPPGGGGGGRLVLEPVPAPVAAPPALPADAREVLNQYEAERAKAQQELQARLAPRRKQLIAQLKALQDRYTKAGQLDEAVAIRDRIRQLVLESGGDADMPLPNPGNLTAYRDRVGQSFYFTVVGTSEGSLWGSDVYTDDSTLALAAVHAGLVQPSQQTVVRVTILPGRASYDGVSRNGIASNGYGPWDGSFSLEAVPGAKAIERPDVPPRNVGLP